VTFLSILGAHSIALPLSPAFPPNELQYIMDQSEASMLLSSSKFESKALDVYKEGLQAKPKHIKLEKISENKTHKEVKLEDSSEEAGGMMLYTSGTTARPVTTLFCSKSQLTYKYYRKASYYRQQH
jgi:malonyl-CoA/methylmalonyl-CoA synthetase